jgi:hypothetical protein
MSAGLAGGAYFRTEAILDALSDENMARLDWNMLAETQTKEIPTPPGGAGTPGGPPHGRLLIRWRRVLPEQMNYQDIDLGVRARPAAREIAELCGLVLLTSTKSMGASRRMRFSTSTHRKLVLLLQESPRNVTAECDPGILHSGPL